MIGFIGLSHLGLNYSLATAAKGFDVTCYDSDPELVKRLQAGLLPIDEPGFKELFETHRTNLRYTSDVADIGKCDIVFYSLDVDTSEKNESNLRPLTLLVEGTAYSLRKGSVAVVLSQVRPGYMRNTMARFRAQASWYYQVETLVFGMAVQRAMEPERHIVGADDPEAPLPEFYRRWLNAFRCPILVMRYESAELAKIAINCFLVATVSTTNTLAELCESIGADWGEIAPALRLDKRIGPYAYLKPGLGIAGGNLERDLVTVRGLAAEHRTGAGIVEAWEENSRRAKSWAMRALKTDLLHTKPAARIAVWGLAYKQDTHSIKNSASIDLIRSLTGCAIHAYDPVAQVDVALFTNLTLHTNAMGTLAEADALVIMTPWKDFSAVPPVEIHRRLHGRLILDPYGMLDRRTCVALGLLHRQIGRA
jgi:UDPglucose 6-dehydrogenase